MRVACEDVLLRDRGYGHRLRSGPWALRARHLPGPERGIVCLLPWQAGTQGCGMGMRAWREKA